MSKYLEVPEELIPLIEKRTVEDRRSQEQRDAELATSPEAAPSTSTSVPVVDDRVTKERRSKTDRRKSRRQNRDQ